MQSLHNPKYTYRKQILLSKRKALNKKKLLKFYSKKRKKNNQTTIFQLSKKNFRLFD